MKQCKYIRTDGSQCVNDVNKEGESYCDIHIGLTEEEIKALKSVRKKLTEDELIEELKIDSPKKIIKLYEEVLIDDFQRLKRLRGTVEEEGTVNNNLTKLSDSVSKKLMMFLEVSNLSEMDKMPDISELFDMVNVDEKNDKEEKV